MSATQNDHAVASERPDLKEQLSYAGGEFASNFAWNMVAGYLLFYYTDIAFLPVAALGTLMLVSRILDAAIDPVVGIIVDRTRTRWGQARPYLLFGAIPFGVLFVLTFAVPDWAPNAKIVWGYVTFTLLGVCYSLLYIPYGALQPMMVRDPALKVRIGAWRSMATSVASMVVYSMVLPIASLTGPEHRATGFTLASIVVAIITVGLYLLVFFQCRERFVAAPTLARRPVLLDLKRLSRNPVWVFIFTYALLTFIRLGVMVSVTAYFANNVMRIPWLLGVMLPLLSVAILAGGFLAGILLKRMTLRLTNVLFIIMSLALYLGMPYLQGNPAAFLAAFMAANVAGGIIGATTFISCTDAVEYNEWRFGDRNEGLLFASISFGMKVGVAIGAAGTAYALSWAGYDPHAVTPRALQMVGWLFYGGPIVVSVLQLIAVVALNRGQRPPADPQPA